MSEINAESIKRLREVTGAGMMDCKKALTESGGDLSAAVDFLRAKGLANAINKSGRVTKQGVISLVTNQNTAAIIELNSETDFVAKNEKFKDLAKQLADIALQSKQNDLQNLMNEKYSDSETVKDAIANAISIIGENIMLTRAFYISVNTGIIGSYVHNALAPNLGGIGALVVLECEKVSDELNKLAKNLAIHVVASQPIARTIETVPHSILEREENVAKDLLSNLIAESGGSKKIDENQFIKGKLAKFYTESVLLEQHSIFDTSKTIAHTIKEVEEKIGAKIAVTQVIRLKVGEEETGFSVI